MEKIDKIQLLKQAVYRNIKNDKKFLDLLARDDDKELREYYTNEIQKLEEIYNELRHLG